MARIITKNLNKVSRYKKAFISIYYILLLFSRDWHNKIKCSEKQLIYEMLRSFQTGIIFAIIKLGKIEKIANFSCIYKNDINGFD